MTRNVLAAAALGILLQILGLAGCAGNGGPTSPNTPSGGNGNAVTGRITDAVDGSQVGSATVQMSGTQATSSGDGSYSITVASSGPVATTIQAGGYLQRETHVRVSGGTTANLTLIPSGKGFDLNFFDHVFRNKGSDGTTRWQTAPAFEIWPQLHTCEPPPSSAGEVACAQVRVQNSVSSAFQDLAQQVIASDASQLTGGFIASPSVSVQMHPAGTLLTQNDFLKNAVVVIMQVDKVAAAASSAEWKYDAATRSTLAADIQIIPADAAVRFVHSHELAHTVGYNHPDGQAAVPVASIMGSGAVSQPSSADMLHGRILYLRPPNSRSPDKDPDSFTVNVLAATAGGAGPTRIVSVQ